MSLTPEDTLRLNVLLRNVKAVRIDEQAMVVHGLGEHAEARVPLNPDCRPSQYLRRVREFLSGATLGSPGGYPVYLRRWTRMGAVKASFLAELLMLGEPEAVTAVVSAEGLSEDIARRAWWASPTADIARRLLRQPAVRACSLGPELAMFLVEFLPFEQESQTVIETITEVLAPGLLAPETRARLWERGERQAAYRIGFLRAVPDDLPAPRAARDDLLAQAPALAQVAGSGNPFAAMLAKLLAAPGQAFLHQAHLALRQPGDQDSAVAALNSVANYLAPVRLDRDRERLVDRAVQRAHAACATGASHPALAELLDAAPALRAHCAAMLALAACDEEVLVPVFAQTDAVGTVMQRRLAPVLAPLFEQFAILLPADALAPPGGDGHGRRRRSKIGPRGARAPVPGSDDTR